MTVEILKNGAPLISGLLTTSDFAPEAFVCNGEDPNLLIPTVITDGVTMLGDGGATPLSSTSTCVAEDQILTDSTSRDITAIGTDDAGTLNVSVVNPSATRNMVVFLTVRSRVTVVFEEIGNYTVHLREAATTNIDSKNINTNPASGGAGFVGDFDLVTPLIYTVLAGATLTKAWNIRVQTTVAASTSATWFASVLTVKGMGVLI